jgi:hypothetical protein
MTKTHLPTHRLLDQGGSVHINGKGSSWSVDVFPYNWVVGAGDPVYHAFHDNEQDARADFDSWKAWPTNGDI